MSRYHSASSYPPSGIADASIHEAATRADLQRHDRDPSPSGSDSSSAFNNYADNPIDDAPAPDDPYHALTSQTLNADGTPKRPMNAFMIFARKRRPQISAANQMMRTGDVSKILSKEWNSMEMSEKKFYLDQAKKLKDNFNSKYPDYVYRRRPNNSRKKRKAEPNHDDPTDAHLADPDDPAYDDPSPIDGDDPLMVPSPQDVQYTRAHPLNPSPPLYHPHEPMPPAPNPACTYPYSSDFHPRLPHLHSDSTLGSTSTIGPIRTSSLDSVGALSQSYHSHQHQHQPHSLYQNPSHAHAHASHLYAAQHHPHAHGGLAGWEPTRRADPPRSTNWPVLLPALDTNLARHQRSMASASVPSGLAAATANGNGNANGSGSGKPSDAYSPPPSVPARPWSSSTSASSSSSAASASASASVSASASHHHYGSASHPHPHPHPNPHQNQNPNAFPTLNSAFFPHESPASKAMDIASSPALPPSSSSDYYSATLSSAGVGVGVGMGMGAAQMATPGTAGGRRTSQETPYGNANPLGWGQAQYGRSGSGPGPGSGSGLHALSPYSLHGSPEQAGSGSATGAGSGSGSGSGAHLGYWDDRFGGR